MKQPVSWDGTRMQRQNLEIQKRYEEVTKHLRILLASCRSFLLMPNETKLEERQTLVFVS